MWDLSGAFSKTWIPHVFGEFNDLVVLPLTEGIARWGRVLVGREWFEVGILTFGGGGLIALLREVVECVGRI